MKVVIKNIFLTCLIIGIISSPPAISDEATQDTTNPQANNVVLDIKTTEQSQNIDSTKLDIQLPSNIENTTTSVQNIKLDDSTTAKITIKATDKKEEKKVEPEKVEPKISAKNTIEEPNINISPKINTTNITGEQKQILTITDGVKNININFKPEISICDGCNQNIKTVPNNTKIANKPKPTKKTKANIKKKKQTNSVKNNTLYQQTKTLDFSNSATTPRKIYENNELSCASGNCNTLVLPTNNKNNIAPQQEKIIEKETKIIEQPVYVINRIISVDEDMELTDETINQIAMDTDSQQIAIVGNNGNTSSKTFSSNIQNDKFKQQYDIITANNLSYGEMAFVDDYDD